jgi:cytochrome oxidase Cu insertion factor (SCO1/SenC/PrrC family)
MNKKMLALMMLVVLLVMSGCQTTAKEEAPVPSTETVVDNEVEADAEPDAEPISTPEKEIKRIVGPFKEMIAPDFTLEDMDGNEVTLSELQGNVVLLTFWTSW